MQNGFMLSVIMLSIIMLSVIMLSVIMLSVILLGNIILNSAGPIKVPGAIFSSKKENPFKFLIGPVQ